MQFNRLLVGAALACVGILPANVSALAACPVSLTGTWHIHGIEADTSGGASVLRCISTFGNGGAFTGTCTLYNVGSTRPQSANASGTLTLSQCELTGSITVPNNPKLLVKYGHINGNLGSGIAIQGTGKQTQVMHLTLVKQ